MNNEIKTFIVVSRFNEEVKWIKDLTDNYIIYNKGESLGSDYKELLLPNIGNNQRDIFEFIYNNYENLPEIMAFIQSNPFDHVTIEKFKNIINNKFFTPIESQSSTWGPVNFAIDGGFQEPNDNWYIHHHYINWGRGGTKIPSVYKSFDEFMNSLFENYNHVNLIRFAPGSQYLIEKRQALYYPKKFWFHLMNVLNRNDMAEGHIIERACFYILTNVYKCKECFND